MNQAIKTKITEQEKSATEPVLKRRFCFTANGNGKPEIKKPAIVAGICGGYIMA